MKTFNNVLELVTYFKDDATCRAYLEEMIWGGNPVCPHCAQDRIYRFKDGKTFKCADKQCNKKFTVTVGTIFDSCKIKLVKWFMAMYYVSNHNKGISSYQLAKHIGVTQKTAWYMLHRLREGTRDKAPVMLRNFVEADETYIGGNITNKHKWERDLLNNDPRANKTGVLGIVERKGKIVVKPITQFGSAVTNEVIKHVEPFSVVNTDSYPGYRLLTAFNISHNTVNHKQGEFVRGHVHTNTIEGAFSMLKRSIYGTFHHVTPKHLARYCDEFAFKYNSRTLRTDERFALALSQCHTVLRYKDLVGKGKTK